MENVIVPSERNCPFTEDGMLLNTFRLIYPQVKSKRIISEVEGFFLQACRSRKGGNPDLFCERDWMPSWRGHDVRAPRHLNYLNFLEK